MPRPHRAVVPVVALLLVASLAALTLALTTTKRQPRLLPARREPAALRLGVVIAGPLPPIGPPLALARGSPSLPPPPSELTVPATIIRARPPRPAAERQAAPWRCGPWTPLASGPITQTVRYCEHPRVATIR